jgi:uncharacterized cupredoxin-like copper-binding protein
MSGRLHRTRRLAVALAGAGAIAVAALAVPALGASTVNETLSNFKISGASSAKAGSVTFKVKNTAGNEHELEVIRTDARAAHLKMSYGRASSKGKVGEVEVGGHATKTLKLKLKKGHYALICNIGNHYAMGMHKDFTVK